MPPGDVAVRALPLSGQGLIDLLVDDALLHGGQQLPGLGQPQSQGVGPSGAALSSNTSRTTSQASSVSTTTSTLSLMRRSCPLRPLLPGAG